jgi:hypothetical protein
MKTPFRESNTSFGLSNFSLAMELRANFAPKQSYRMRTEQNHKQFLLIPHITHRAALSQAIDPPLK